MCCVKLVSVLFGPHQHALAGTYMDSGHTLIRVGHLWCQIGSRLTNLSLNVGSGSYHTSAVVGTHLLPYLLTIP